jgi:hypothetical protein
MTILYLVRLIARPLSKQLPSPVGLTFRIQRLRWLDSNQRWGIRHVGLAGRSLLPTRVHRITMSGWRDLNPRSRAPDDQASLGARRCPHGRETYCAELSKNREHREGLEPALPHDHRCAAVPGPVHLSVGPEGLEPSPGGLRIRCAAASTLIPISRRGGSRTLSLTLKARNMAVLCRCLR